MTLQWFLNSYTMARYAKGSSIDLRKIELASLFRSGAISILLRSPKIGQMTFNHPKTSQDRGNQPRWVQWCCLFSVSKWSDVTGSKFSKYRCYTPHSGRSYTLENLDPVTSDHFETENKQHHWTQRGWLPLSWLVLGWLNVIWPILGLLSKILIAPERNKLASSILRRSIEDPLAYLAMV
jgi:hypothetical protein